MNCKKYLLGLVTMGLVTACTDLDPEIYSNLTTTNAYSTESDIEAAVVGLYSDMNPYPGDAWLYYGGYYDYDYRLCYRYRLFYSGWRPD